MAVRLTNGSALRFTDLLSVDGFRFWEVADLPTIPTQRDDVLHRVSQVDRLDLLANRYYGDPVLWWVIAVANDIEIWPTQLNIGTTLRVPSPRYVRENLFQTAVT
jgi:nucleoid-associated protein YgaU